MANRLKICRSPKPSALALSTCVSPITSSTWARTIRAIRPAG